jgi:hypothetical protein
MKNALLIVGLIFTVSTAVESANALNRCRVTRDRASGALEVSARGISGNVRWGESSSAITNSFFDLASCVRRGNLRKCTLAQAGTNAASTPPVSCAVWIADESDEAPCRAMIPNCTVLGEISSDLSQIVEAVREVESSLSGEIASSSSQSIVNQSTLQTGQSSAGTKLDTLLSRQATASEKLEALQNGQSTASDALSGVSSGVSALQNSASSQNTSLTNLTAAVSSLASSITTLQGSLNTVDGNVDSLVNSSQDEQGVILLNQANALSGHPNIGEGAGFPIQLFSPGVYKLTSNLTVPAGTSGILITGDSSGTGANGSFIIDLNGYTIEGPVRGCPDACSSSGAADGITYLSHLPNNVTIKNGIIKGFEDNGISSLGDNLTIENVTFDGNAGIGASTSRETSVKGCRFINNGEDGFYNGFGPSVITDSLFHNNQSDGARLLNGNASITDSIFTSNGGDGLQSTSGLEGTLIKNSVLSSNGGYGLNLDSSVGYGSSVINNNTAGSVLGGHQLGTNICGDDTTCP